MTLIIRTQRMLNRLEGISQWRRASCNVELILSDHRQHSCYKTTRIGTELVCRGYHRDAADSSKIKPCSGALQPHPELESSWTKAPLHDARHVSSAQMDTGIPYPISRLTVVSTLGTSFGVRCLSSRPPAIAIDNDTDTDPGVRGPSSGTCA